MSKSALFAGLGQGLMAAGQNIGEAYRMKAIEELRQENLQQNWAREDKIRAEDRKQQEKVRAEDRADRVMQSNQSFAQRKALAEMGWAREDSSKDVKTVFETDDEGNHYQVSYNKNGEESNRVQYDPSKDTDTPKSVIEESKIYRARAEALREQDPEGNKERIDELYEQSVEVLKRARVGGDSELKSQFISALEDSEKANQDNKSVTASKGSDQVIESKPDAETMPSNSVANKPRGLMQQGSVNLVESPEYEAPDGMRGSLPRTFSRWMDGNEVVSQAWDNPDSIEQMDAYQLSTIIRKKQGSDAWGSIVNKAIERLKALQQQ